MVLANKVYFDLFGLLIKYLFFNNKLNKCIKLSRVDFYYLLNIILKFNDIFIVFYNLRFFNVAVKDYRFFILNELIFTCNCLYFFSFKLLNKVQLDDLFNINKLLLRIDSILFFVLNVYIEYCRIFFYNSYISLNLNEKKYLNLKKYFINTSNNRYSLGNLFVLNILFDKYLIYSGYYNYYFLLNKFNLNQMHNILNQLNKYNKLNLFNLKFLLFFINLFNKQIYLFILYYIYKSWLSFSWLFKFKICSLKDMYILVKDSKENNLYIFLLTYIFDLKENILKVFNKNFYIKDMYNNYNGFICCYDFIFIDYVSLLFLKYFKNFNLTNFNKLGLDISYLWEIFVNWYHFDLCLYDYFDLYLKYYIDFSMVKFINSVPGVDKSLIKYSQIDILDKYMKVDNSLFFFYSFFFEVILCIFVFIDLNKILNIFIYSFFIEYYFKILSNNKLLGKYEQYTQFLIFYYLYNYSWRFRKLYKFICLIMNCL